MVFITFYPSTIAISLPSEHYLLQFVKGDIQSMDLLSFVLQTEEIDTIMHFAAQVYDIYALPLGQPLVLFLSPDWS